MNHAKRSFLARNIANGQRAYHQAYTKAVNRQYTVTSSAEELQLQKVRALVAELERIRSFYPAISKH